jgi:hypothetical protein
MDEMKTVTIAIIGIISVGILLGCSVQVKLDEKSETDMGSHHVVVKPPSIFTSNTSLSGGVSRVYQYSAGKVAITIRDDELIVNNAKYGKLAQGDPILVDDGKVAVAGQLRQGTPMSPEEKETIQALAGYQVSVRPGASCTPKTEVVGSCTLSVGDTTVSITNSRLSVRDMTHGELKPGDTVSVENSEVVVSGAGREAPK